VDFLAIGHVTLDERAGAVQPGGAAYYAAMTAHRLGLRAGLLTSFGDDYPGTALPEGIEIARVSASQTTRYAVAGSARGRRLALRARATDLAAGDVPAAWRETSLVALCPVAGEVDPRLAASFADAAVAALPQGWMRRVGPGGAISCGSWDQAPAVLPHVQLVSLSEEDAGAISAEVLVEWFQQVPLSALTRGAGGATLYVNGEPYHVGPDPVAAVDDTGAGDVFAAALLIEYQRRDDPWLAAAAATCAAAASVTGTGAAAIPDRAQLEARLAAYLRRQSG
jgi:sugar/nucleoside kinase (ribokinase family)